MIELILFFSLVVNGLLVWYITKLFRKFAGFQETLDFFSEHLEEYHNHIDMVYNLERFYGDETLARLLKHSKLFVEQCDEMCNFLNFDANEEDEYGEEEN